MAASKERFSEGTMTRVLIVDDHPSVTKACCRLFGDLGARDVRAASDTRTGFHGYVTQQPDIAIIDLKFGSDALAGLSLIRQIRIHSAAVVIVALSMNDDPATRKEALDAGATAFVNKDAPIGELLQACKFWQEKRAA
jgi:DNA-binding NarL/FixJ family response regulator